MTEEISTAQHYEQLLQRVWDQLRSPTEDGLQQAVAWLDEASSLTGDENEELTALHQRVQKELEFRRARQLYEETRTECERLWAQEQELLKAKVPPDTVLQNVFLEALHLAEEACTHYLMKPDRYAVLC